MGLGLIKTCARNPNPSILNPKVFKLAEDPHEEVRAEALKAVILGQAHASTSFTPLLRYTQDGRRVLRASVLSCLARRVPMQSEVQFHHKVSSARE